jgi:hypothetical protein
MGEAIRNGSPMHPGFETAVTRHRMLDMVTEAGRTGRKQVR